MFWPTFGNNGQTEVFIVEAGFLGMARMKAGVAGQKGTSIRPNCLTGWIKRQNASKI